MERRITYDIELEEEDVSGGLIGGYAS